VSPAILRRYRAERLLREEFESLRARVTGAARRRLLASGVRLDQSDLEACYAQAWQGLYSAVLDGHQIANPAGWLVLVTFRRAIEEHRSRRLVASGEDRRQDGDGIGELRQLCAPEHDLARELDDRIRLRQLFEGMRGRLSARELQAATLCYLHGLTRAEAAARMGVSEARMQKLMEGHGSDRPGVAGKVGALVETIREGRWCAEQASLMRGYAYGILDPDGDRYRLARAHRDECPACRAYVLSLRGLAVVLPPVLPPWPLAAAVLGGAGTQAVGSAGGTVGASGAAGTGGAASAGGAGAAAAGAPMLAGGSLAAKLVAGCLLALGAGVGCVALTSARAHDGGPARPHASGGPRPIATVPSATAPRSAAPRAAMTSAPGANAARPPLGGHSHAALATIREFRPEQAGAPRAAAPSQAVRGLAAGGAQREFGPG
jgi:DNA-directed RNA polymerase specialized sigma24 family protein